MPAKRIYLSPPDAGEAELSLLTEAFQSNWIAPLGPHVNEFEAELAARSGVAAAAALSSGTAALHLALQLLGVGEGDVVLCSTLTFIASASPILYLGAEPVFIDADASWTLDPALVDAEIRALDAEGRRPKALVAVDLYGQMADYAALEAICRRWEVALVEDAAEALGSTRDGKPAGAFGACAIFSFNGNKIITTSGGGMLVSNDVDMVTRSRFLASQAREPAPHYEHEVIGYNYRMSNLLAAVGRGQLQGLEAKVDRRRAHFEAYLAALGDLPGVAFMPEAPGSRSNRWLTCLTIDPGAFGASREDVRLALEAENIESRPVWKPMHQQPVFEGVRTRGGDVSDRLFRDGLCLPSGSSLSDDDRGRVIEIFRSTSPSNASS